MEQLDTVRHRFSATLPLVNLTPGVLIGPYRVVGLIGTGGMAEVYRARDTRLRRDVAIKVVAAALGDDASSRERFEREARLAGSVSHPNVVALYDVGFQDDKPYLVTEFLRGETLQERLAGGVVSISKALQWAGEMAEGLAAAHERGIIHRDLKVANVFITRDEHVKLLDFGIAKLTDAVREPGGLLEETPWRTQSGTVLGTPGYMSPEQMRGEPVDERSDCFSLGAVLYEMLSGQQAFSAATAVEVGYAVLHGEPQPLPETVPPAVVQVVRRCLEKDPARRFQSARDLAFHLEVLRNPSGSSVPREPESGLAGPERRRRLYAAVALVAGLAIGGGAAIVARRPPPAAPSVQRLTYHRGTVTGARFGPDGRVIYSAAWAGAPDRLFASVPGSTEAQPLELPAARLLAVRRGDLAIALKPTSTLAVAPVVGGAPRQMATSTLDADWSPTGELAVVRYAYGKFQLEYPLGTPLLEDTGVLRSPRVSPTGDSVAVWSQPNDALPNELVLVDRKGKARHLLEAQISGMAWAPGGDEIWFSDGAALWASSRDGKRRLVYQGVSTMTLLDIGYDGRVIVNVQDNRAEISVFSTEVQGERVLPWLSSSYSDLYAISRDGKQVLVSAHAMSGRPSPVTFIRPTDGSAPVRLGPFRPLDLSPDEQWVAAVGEEDTGDLVLLPVAVGAPRRVHVGNVTIGLGRWLHDGKRVALEAEPRNQRKQWNLFLVPIDGGEAPRLLTDAPVDGWLEVSPDDRLVATNDAEGILTLYPLDRGPPIPLSSLAPGSAPAGWTSDGQLWVYGAQKGSAGGPMQLLRYDVSRRQIMEERPVGPSDRTGFVRNSQVLVTPDGRHTAIEYTRSLGSLYLIDGLVQRR